VVLVDLAGRARGGGSRHARGLLLRQAGRRDEGGNQQQREADTHDRLHWRG
jgi:hypothetical protein